jgi:carboxypeptidase C (cathepsin A)
MGLNAQQHANVTLGYYPAGHMMYIRDESLGTLKKDISSFMSNALK